MNQKSAFICSASCIDTLGSGSNSSMPMIDIEELNIETKEDVLRQFHLKFDADDIGIIIDASMVNKYQTRKIKNFEANINNYIDALIEYASSRDIVIMRMSTFEVFDGSGNEPYVETDEAKPITKYGEMMLESENRILDNSDKSIVIRLPWMYSILGKENFIYQLIYSMFHNDELFVFDDQIGNLCNVFDLQRLFESVMYKILSSDFIFGSDRSDRIYHLSAKGFCSKFEIANEIHRIFSKLFAELLKTKNIVPILSNQESNEDKMMKNCCLSSRKLITTFRGTLPDWHFSLYNATQKIVKSIIETQ